MNVNVLAVGDICDQAGIDILEDKLGVIKKQYDIAFTVINGENAGGLGVTPKQAQAIRTAGADVITLGNHTWSKPEIKDYLDNNKHIVRPANFAPQVPGAGWRIAEAGFGQVCVISLIGRVDVDIKSENPFIEVDRILKRILDNSENDTLLEPTGDSRRASQSALRNRFQKHTVPTVILVDFHASATSEKTAMAYHLDGRASALWGTHTHVQTSDARVFPKGLGYITDLGMTGPLDSIIGMNPKESISNFLGNPPERFLPAKGPSRIEGAVFEIDTETGKCQSVEAIRVS